MEDQCLTNITVTSEEMKHTAFDRHYMHLLFTNSALINEADSSTCCSSKCT